MGCCLSSTGSGAEGRGSKTDITTTESVISANGDLHQYTIPLTVSKVLEMEFPTSTPPAANYFVCNSDHLYYDDYIPALDVEDELQANQIYFVLPVSKLQYRLTASDMAALAVKASLALQKSNTNKSSSSNSKKHSSSSSSFYNRNRGHGRGRNNKSARISPISADQVNSASNSSSSSSYDGDGDYKDENHRNEQTVTSTIKKGISVVSDKQQPAAAALGVSKSGSVRKLQRYSSKRAKMAVRSFRIRLTTIYE
jgi:hypothetical protein